MKVYKGILVGVSSLLLMMSVSPQVNAEEKKSETSKIEKATDVHAVIKIDQQLPKVYTGQPFIDLISEAAMKTAADHGIYASVMIAQAVLESNYGKSALSQSPNNNLFGIKGKGKLYQTLEDNGSGELFKIKSSFRMYSSYNDSLTDYADLIKNGLTYNSTYYAGAWKVNTSSYVDAVHHLEGKYATDTKYADKLIHLIKMYDLTRFDVDEYAYYIADKMYTVKEGDTLQKIATANKAQLDDLMRWNKLDSDTILIGQQLIVTIKKIDEVATIQNPNVKAKSTDNESEKIVQETKIVRQAPNKPETVVKELKNKEKPKVEVIDKAPIEKQVAVKKKEIVYKATKYYKVKPGDSLTSIALQHNITDAQLKKWNKLKNASLKNGEKLIVDVKGSSKLETRAVKKQSRYVIQQGDSLASIASRFNTTEQTLIKMNNLDSTFVYDGQVIKVK